VPSNGDSADYLSWGTVVDVVESAFRDEVQAALLTPSANCSSLAHPPDRGQFMGPVGVWTSLPGRPSPDRGLPRNKASGNQQRTSCTPSATGCRRRAGPSRAGHRPSASRRRWRLEPMAHSARVNMLDSRCSALAHACWHVAV